MEETRLGRLKVEFKWVDTPYHKEILAIDGCYSHLGISCLTKRALQEFRKSSIHRGMVVLYKGCVVGYTLYETYKTTVVVPRLVVHPQFLRRGIGWQIVTRLQKQLNTNREWLQVEVPETALSAHLLLRSTGFWWAESVPGSEDYPDIYIFLYRKIRLPAALHQQRLELQKAFSAYPR